MERIPKDVERAERWRMAGRELRERDPAAFAALLCALEALANFDGDLDSINETYNQH